MLEARQLACVRGGREVVAGVGFGLRPGEVLTLLGPNGSGKSSLLRVLAGLLRPALGELLWAGAPVQNDLSAYRTKLHYVGHADGIKSLLTVRENLAFTCALNRSGEAAIEQAFELFDLGFLADTPARFLSSGQKRRLGLARLLAGERPLWLLDEPGVGLDAENRARLEQAIEAHRKAGGIAVLATHGDVRVENALALELKRAEPLPDGPAPEDLYI
jgi:heme exporter protein A